MQDDFKVGDPVMIKGTIYKCKLVGQIVDVFTSHVAVICPTQAEETPIRMICSKHKVEKLK
jgi:hypothetical protein